MKRLAGITNGLIGQPMFKMLEKVEAMEKNGRKIYHFELGDSDFGSPAHIREATKQALDRDYTRYVNSAGIVELRTAIANHIEDSLGFRPSLKQILVMPANAIIDFVIRCVADPGEEVLIPDPGFPTYMAVTNYTGVKKVSLPVRQEDGFHINPDEIDSRVTSETRLLIINTPQNPTGAMLTRDEVEAIYKVAEKKDIFILSDEVYSQVKYDKVHYSPGVFDQCKERTIILNSFTKNYSMSGWRLGYAVGPESLIQKLAMLYQTTYSCTSPFIQCAGIAALQTKQQFIEDRIGKLKTLRDLIVKKLNEIPGISCTVPEGAYYVFPCIKGTGMSSAEFSDFVLEKAGVALVPGNCFGNYGEGYVRFCFVRKPEIIEEACERMKIEFSKIIPRIKVESAGKTPRKHQYTAKFHL